MEWLNNSLFLNCKPGTILQLLRGFWTEQMSLFLIIKINKKVFYLVHIIVKKMLESVHLLYQNWSDVFCSFPGISGPDSTKHRTHLWTRGFTKSYNWNLYKLPRIYVNESLLHVFEKKINKVIKINFCLKIISKTIATQIPI